MGVIHKNLQDVYESLLQRNLSEALYAMQTYLIIRPSERGMTTYEDISKDFQLMTDYWQRGYKDPQAEDLYNRLLVRMYELYVSMSVSLEIMDSSIIGTIYKRVYDSIGVLSIKDLQNQLENFVSEVAMLDFEPEQFRKEKRKQLYRRHHELLNDWFDYIWLYPSWNSEMTQDIESLLLSPTVDGIDQQLLVSSVTIAFVNHFDVNKLRVLLHVYQKSGDEALRQRALVGWVFGLSDDILPVLYADDVREIQKLLEDKAVCEELTELEHQIYLCMNAEKDNQTIQEEILPGLLKNSNFRVTRNGIEEVEENPMENILHPDAEERKMEEMERTYRRMQDMQKQGSDIYFGGFSQMKRFAFFKDAINWFVPFYMEHPGISDIVEKYFKNRFLSTMVHSGPFCNSDKYSFMLSFSQVVDRMPKEVLQMLEMGEASIEENFGEEMKTKAFIRRTYLQDLYRFYRLFSYRSLFVNPFERDVCLFFANPIFSQTHLEPYFEEIASTLMKQKRINEAAAVLDNVGEPRRNIRFYLMTGYLAQNYGCKFMFSSNADSDSYRKVLEMDPDNEQALNGLAKSAFLSNHFDEALRYYDQLLVKCPDKKNYILNHSVCLTKLLRYKDALKELYQLNYECPDDRKVNKVFAWTLTCDGRYDQAISIYQQLLTDKADKEDLLNYGYCLWFNGNVSDAADCFHRYLNDTGENRSVILEIERELIKDKGITNAEQQMMLGIL